MARDYKKTILGERLARYRRQAGFSTVEALSNAITDMNISKGTLTNIEAGRRKDVSVQELLSISRALGISPISLICEVEQPNLPYEGEAYSDRPETTNGEVVKLFDPTCVGDSDEDDWFESVTGNEPSDAAKRDSEIWSEFEILSSYREQEGIHAVLSHQLLVDGDVEKSQEHAKLAKNFSESIRMVQQRLIEMGVHMPDDSDSYKALHVTDLGLAAKHGNTGAEQAAYEEEP